MPLPPEDIHLPWERAVSLVDMALYMAKLHGRNCAYGIRRLRRSDDEAMARIERNLGVGVGERHGRDAPRGRPAIDAGESRTATPVACCVGVTRKRRRTAGSVDARSAAVGSMPLRRCTRARISRCRSDRPDAC